MPSNIQENLPVAFAMLEKVPDKWRCHSYTNNKTNFTIIITEGTEGILG